ncbi:MAG TPA: hypothetical protein VJN67_11995 [Stellaceae bacterium]|nr:hypothetical protein [Stellaceae bacterium]
MTVVDVRRLKPRLGLWPRLVPAVLAAGLLAGCVVVPAYGPGPNYRGGYYAPSGGYYYPYYRDRDDYYRRW